MHDMYIRQNRVKVSFLNINDFWVNEKYQIKIYDR